MLKVSLSLVTLLIVCHNLVGCNTPEIRDLRQQNLRLVLETDPDTGRRYINESESACFSRHYRHTKNYVGSVGQESENDVTDCNDMIGYGARDYTDLAVFFEEVRVEVNKKNKRKRK